MEDRRRTVPPKSALDRISTQWSIINDPGQFVVRYASAIQRYLGALIRNTHDAEEVLQDFLMRVVKDGFARAGADRGRFRDYLKVSIRNAAISRLRKKAMPLLGDSDKQRALAPGEPLPELDAEWIAEWRRCVLARAWRLLEARQRRSPGNLFHTVLRLTADHPDEDSEQLAARASEKIGRPLRADAFRKQVSRARREFSGLLLEEIAQTIEAPTPERIEQELIDVGLMEHVREYLPSDWRTTK